MKSFCWLWILILTVVAATLDRVPDPPYAKPEFTRIAISTSHGVPATAAVCHEAICNSQRPEWLAVLALQEYSLPLHQTDAVERGTDSSPPPSHL